jgi:hypothetical protein
MRGVRYREANNSLSYTHTHTHIYGPIHFEFLSYKQNANPTHSIKRVNEHEALSFLILPECSFILKS